MRTYPGSVLSLPKHLLISIFPEDCKPPDKPWSKCGSHLSCS
nr:MAG TPA: hypothetical protein [Caudoviricetes sp.]